MVRLGDYLPMSAPRFRQSDGEVLAEWVHAQRRAEPSLAAGFGTTETS